MNYFRKHNTRTPLLAVALMASLCASATPPASAQFVAPYGSGYQGADGMQYNSMQGATMSVMLQGMQNMSMMRSSMYSSMRSYHSRRTLSGEELQARRGQRLIKAGRATLKFPMRAWPSNYWMANTRVNTSVPAAQDRRTRSSGMQLQRAEFARQVKVHGAQWGDMADMMAIATVIAVESYTGRKVNNAGFRAQSAIWRRAWLKDAYFQGRTVADKQKFYEGQILLGGTYPWWLRNVKGDRANAKKHAARFFDEWYKDKTPGLLRDYVKYLTGNGSDVRLASAPVPAGTSTATIVTDDTPDAPQMTIAQASAFVQYEPVAPSVLPTLLIARSNRTDRQKSLQLYEDIVKAGRENFQKLFVSANHRREDVADGLTFALMTFY